MKVSPDMKMAYVPPPLHQIIRQFKSTLWRDSVGRLSIQILVQVDDITEMALLLEKSYKLD